MAFLKYAGIAVVALVVGWSSHGSQSLGGVYNQVAQKFPQGIYVGSADQYSISTSGSVTTTGNITAQGGTATSSLVAGCFQALATSSATKIKLIFSTKGATSTYKGTAYWSYGTCP